MRRHVVLSAFLIAWPALSGAGELRVSITVPQPLQPKVGVAAVVRAALAAEIAPLAAQAGGQAIEANATLPGAVALAVPGGSVLTVSADADGWWIESTVVALAAGESKSIALKARPLSTLLGRLSTEKPAELPSTLEIRFAETAGSLRADPLQGKTACQIEIEAGRFDCPTPVGQWDLVLRAPGFAPSYLWDRELTLESALSVGDLRLIEGGSLSGRVVAESGEPQAEDLEVRLEAQRAATPSTVDQLARGERGGLSADIDKRGFFQFTGLAPGTYRLVAAGTGYADSELAPVIVMKGMETTLRESLILRSPRTLTVGVSPATDPQARPWRVRLERATTIPGDYEVVGESQVSEEGLAAWEMLSGGSYLVTVRGGDGSQMAHQRVELDSPEGARLEIDLPLVAITGMVLLGDDPLQAELFFGGRNGAVRVMIEADDDGRFSGVLPRAGQWDVDVVASDPEVRTRLTDVDVDEPQGDEPVEIVLHIPDTVVHGTVVDVSSEPIEGAMVKIFQPSTTGATWTFSDEDGAFETRGLQPREIVLEAEAQRGSELLSSGAHSLVVSEDEPQNVRLVLTSRRVIAGRVTHGGSGVPGALVRVAALGASGALQGLSLPETSTDLDGSFSLHVDSSASAAELVVLPPGHTLLATTVGAPARDLFLEVDDLGGTLRLLTPANTEGVHFYPLLTYEGLLLDINTLRRWQFLNRQDATLDGDMLLVAMPAGRYQLCAVSMESGPRSLAAVWEAIRSPAPGCQQGLLSPLGALELTANAQQ